jgi:type IV pilus assembly protein PilP
MRAFACTALVLALCPVALAARQAPTPPPPAPPAPARAPGGSAASEPPESYAYQPDGRRDPFLNLLGTTPEGRPLAHKSDGPASLAVSDISVRGVLESRGTLIAMIQGPDNRTYIVRQGDRLADGTIKSITPQGLIIEEEVNDPLSLVKQREVRKLLRSLEDGKE